MAERGIDVDHVTIHRWVQWFTDPVALTENGRGETAIAAQLDGENEFGKAVVSRRVVGSASEPAVTDRNAAARAWRRRRRSAMLIGLAQLSEDGTLIDLYTVGPRHPSTDLGWTTIDRQGTVSQRSLGTTSLAGLAYNPNTRLYYTISPTSPGGPRLLSLSTLGTLQTLGPVGANLTGGLTYTGRRTGSTHCPTTPAGRSRCTRSSWPGRAHRCSRSHRAWPTA